MMEVQFMVMTVFVISSFIIYQINCQTCSYVFRNIAPNHERNYDNSAYKKGEYSHVLYCAKFCAKDSICTGFVLFRELMRIKLGKIACVFLNDYSAGKDLVKNSYADYYEREASASVSTSVINSAQFYAADSTLVVNTNSHAFLYKITEINNERGITGTLESRLPLSIMYADWNDPPQASFTIPDVTFLVNGQKHQCFNKVSPTRYEKCSETGTYTFFSEIFQSDSDNPLDSVVSFPGVLYVFSGNMVYYVKKTSSDEDKDVVYTAVEKSNVDDPADSNMWTNIPVGHTAITMVDGIIAVVFTGNKYYLYDTTRKTVLVGGYLGGQTDEYQSCKTDSQS